MAARQGTEYWQAQVEGWRQSGLSQITYCEHHGLNIKFLIWDGTGVWLCQRRLHRGHFIWPSADTPVCTLTAAQWQWLIAGVDWQRLSAPPPAHWQV